MDRTSNATKELLQQIRVLEPDAKHYLLNNSRYDPRKPLEAALENRKLFLEVSLVLTCPHLLLLLVIYNSCNKSYLPLVDLQLSLRFAIGAQKHSR